MRQYPLQALRRPYRRLPCRWRRDAAPGRTRHCPSPLLASQRGVDICFIKRLQEALSLASQREDTPAPAAGPTSPYCRAHGWTRRQETFRGSSPGISSTAAAKRRPWIRPRTPAEKSEHPGAQNGHQRAKWQPLQGEGHSISAALSAQTGLALARSFLSFFAPYLLVGNYISKQYTITPIVFLTLKKPAVTNPL